MEEVLNADFDGHDEDMELELINEEEREMAYWENSYEDSNYYD